MASEKLFYMNRTKRKKRFWDSHSAKGAQAFALVALWERYGPMSEKISLFKSLLPSLSLSVPDLSIRCEKVNIVYI